MNIPGHCQLEQEYGCLSYFHHIILGPNEVDCLVHTITKELGTCGLTTPFLFSSLSLNIDASGVRCLIQAFLHTCVLFPVLDAERIWHKARFASPTELAMCLRWGLAQVLHISGDNARTMPCLATLLTAAPSCQIASCVQHHMFSDQLLPLPSAFVLIICSL